jgi:transposase
MPKDFQVLRLRWVVERTFVWLGHSRHLSQDFEELPLTDEAWISLALSMRMLASLAK